ncbi:succinate dehydrogenase hydrophobic membrane anchor subunit [Jiangella gansuensis]|uniref:succinate dehydrogenase hydrophobic membrane anchor subunit n=1 Tax=Jiangella gansuensis TaxID=281473 RepID=UPI00047A4421|nr:succinate dehydrogenase hydrophobic membrane anchor subunit [Jiangella gansuensis]
MTTTIPSPRSPRTTRRLRGRTNTELYSWLFMRASGVLLLILVFTHLFVNLMTGDGINALDFAFVAGKWADPVWQVWDLVMLWLAMIHGTNGMRTVINDYAERDQVRMWLKIGLYTATTITIVLGTLVIFTFDPCPPDAAADLLPSFCSAS